MTESPSEARGREATAVVEHFAALVDATSFSAEHGTAKIVVPADRWVEVHQALKEHLPFFSMPSGQRDISIRVPARRSSRERTVRRRRIIAVDSVGS